MNRYTGTDLALAVLGGILVGIAAVAATRPRSPLPAGAAVTGQLPTTQVPFNLWPESVKQNVARTLGVTVADLPRVLMVY